MNLLGAMLLRMGWTDDRRVLSEPCLLYAIEEIHTEPLSRVLLRWHPLQCMLSLTT
jgi:hypothetical protein